MVGMISGFVVASWRQASWWLAGALVVSVAGAFVTGEIATAPLILVNLAAGLASGLLLRIYVRFARRLWTTQ